MATPYRLAHPALMHSFLWTVLSPPAGTFGASDHLGNSREGPAADKRHRLSPAVRAQISDGQETAAPSPR
jgi:hypothetical protein